LFSLIVFVIVLPRAL